VKPFLEQRIEFAKQASHLNASAQNGSLPESLPTTILAGTYPHSPAQLRLILQVDLNEPFRVVSPPQGSLGPITVIAADREPVPLAECINSGISLMKGPFESLPTFA
jgi:hypothetical protein